MKKRIFLGLVLVTVAAGGAFALPEFKLSAGAGGYFTSDFGGGVEGSSSGRTASVKIPYAGGGGFAFFDATYAELSLGFWGGGGTFTLEGDSSKSEADLSFMGLDIGVLGKYPLAVSEKLSIAPLFGITYRAMLSVKDENDENDENDGDAGDFSALWFKFGGGVDYSFTDALYLRGGFLYGVRLSNKFENDLVDTEDAKPLLGHGLEVKIAVGYRF
jgi:hypothetical protein